MIRLEKIILFCASVDKLVRFYSDHFGFTVVGEPGNDWAELEAGVTHIAFHRIGSQYLPVSPEDFKMEESNLKLVFEIETGLEALREKLVDKNVRVGEIKRFPGSEYIYCDGNDPEGNVFQLIQYDKRP